MSRDRIPLSIITGFLGSGKTTLLNHLLQNVELSKTLVIINEFGEIGIDHLLVSTPIENMRLLSNGCLCCEMRGDLVETLADAARQLSEGVIPPFNRVIVETTGLADPVPLVRTVVTDVEVSPSFLLDSVVTVVDAVNSLVQFNEHSEAVKQVAVSDLLLVSKSDIADKDTVNSVRNRILAINASAEVMLLTHGKIAPAFMFGRSAIGAEMTTEEFERWLGRAVGECTLANHEHCDHALHHQDHVHHDDNVSTFSLTLDRIITSDSLKVWLTMLANFLSNNLLRVKGIINVEGIPVVINVVQTVVHDPITLKHWPSEDRRTRIVFIVKNMDREKLEKTVDALGEPQTQIATDQSTLQGAYAQFLNMANRFK